MKTAGAGLFAGQERCTDLDTLCPESQSRDYTARVANAARCDHRHIDDVHNLRHQ